MSQDLVHVFAPNFPNKSSGSGPVAVTRNPEGNNLPDNGTGYPWIRIKSFDLSLGGDARIGANSSDLRAALDSAGFYIQGFRV